MDVDLERQTVAGAVPFPPPYESRSPEDLQLRGELQPFQATDAWYVNPYHSEHTEDTKVNCDVWHHGGSTQGVEKKWLCRSSTLLEERKLREEACTRYSDLVSTQGYSEPSDAMYVYPLVYIDVTDSAVLSKVAEQYEALDSHLKPVEIVKQLHHAEAVTGAPAIHRHYHSGSDSSSSQDSIKDVSQKFTALYVSRDVRVSASQVDSLKEFASIYTQSMGEEGMDVHVARLLDVLPFVHPSQSPHRSEPEVSKQINDIWTQVMTVALDRHDFAVVRALVKGGLYPSFLTLANPSPVVTEFLSTVCCEVDDTKGFFEFLKQIKDPSPLVGGWISLSVSHHSTGILGILSQVFSKHPVMGPIRTCLDLVSLMRRGESNGSVRDAVAKILRSSRIISFVDKHAHVMRHLAFDASGASALHYAVMTLDSRLVLWLQKHAGFSPIETDSYGLNAFFYLLFAHHGEEKVLPRDQLISCLSASTTDRPLWRAIREKLYIAIQLLHGDVQVDESLLAFLQLGKHMNFYHLLKALHAQTRCFVLPRSIVSVEYKAPSPPSLRRRRAEFTLPVFNYPGDEPAHVAEMYRTGTDTFLQRILSKLKFNKNLPLSP